ncbi:hypothetical protein [Methylorubrum populi]
MPATHALFLAVGAIIGSGIGYAYLSARAFDRKHLEARETRIS